MKMGSYGGRLLFMSMLIIDLKFHRFHRTSPDFIGKSLAKPLS